MKINITIQPEDIGFVNISPLKGENPFQLLVDNNECTEIIADTILDYVSYEKIGEVLQHYVSKLRHGGTLVVGGTDIVEVVKMVLSEVDIQKTNALLYGSQSHPWECKRGCHSIIEVSNYLQSIGLQVVKKRLDNGKFIVTAVRP